MDQQQIITDLERRAKAAGLSMAEVCKKAGIHQTTFSRWKRTEKNPNPGGAPIPSVARIEAVIAEREHSSEAA